MKNRKLLLIGALSIICFLLGFVLFTDTLLKKFNTPTSGTVSSPSSSQKDYFQQIQVIIENAKQLAASYDYDKAISLLQSHPDYNSNNDIIEQLNTLQQERSNLIKVDVTKIPHIFFHPLIYDAKTAFSSSSKQSFHTASVTVTEFEKILTQLHANGYVLVSLHDVMEPVTKDGQTKLKKGDIYLPPGKKPIILSEDDTNYYKNWDGLGIANRLVVDSNGEVKAEIDHKDGSSTIGNYDLVPILNEFVKKHPDFSYRGSKAIIAVTGFEGVFGYRTSSYHPGDHHASRQDGKNYDVRRQDFDPDSEDAKKARQVAHALKESGFELASHSFVHQRFDKTAISDDFFLYDLKRVKHEIESITGKLDILLYPNGTDITQFYQSYNNDKWGKLLLDYGFRYFCSTDSTTRDNKTLNASFLDEDISNGNYFRSGRLAIDGFMMYHYKEKLHGILGIDIPKIWDPHRPNTPPNNYNNQPFKR